MKTGCCTFVAGHFRLASVAYSPPALQVKRHNFGVSLGLGLDFDQDCGPLWYFIAQVTLIRFSEVTLGAPNLTFTGRLSKLGGRAKGAQRG